MKYFHNFVVDASTDTPNKGNPAAVIIYDKNKFVDDIWLQNVANEFNLSETCFLTPVTEDRFYLRWFSPTVEVDLCGHGTLASAHTLFSNGFVNSDVIEFAVESFRLNLEMERTRCVVVPCPLCTGSLLEPKVEQVGLPGVRGFFEELDYKDYVRYPEGESFAH